MPDRIKNVERIIAQVPFGGAQRRDIVRAELHKWSELEIIRVETESGIVGWGETVQHYTWGKVEDTDSVIGKTPFETMWDDRLGPGLQMALFDAAGKVAGVPVYRLIGDKCRDYCAMSYWHHDMAPQQYADEAATAVKLGYVCMKIKMRPWFDVRETIRLISEGTPDDFCVDGDWNEFLNDAGTAIPVLRELESLFPKIKMWEDPIRRDDGAGNRHLRNQVDRPIAHHYQFMQKRDSLELGGVCDGWILNMGVEECMRQGNTCRELKMPLFLQLVGTGLTAALSLHLSAVLKAAQWPTITCHELYEHNMCTARIPISGGYARVPEAPGLGVEFDEAALEKYRVEEADHAIPRHLIRVTRPGGTQINFARTEQMWDFYMAGNQPVDEWGCHTELLDDDGSADFAKLYAQANASPVIAQP